MAKNNLVIQQYKRELQVVKDIVPKVMAITVIALYEEYGFDAEKCHDFCDFSQELWQQAIDEHLDIYKWCEDVTGIEMQARITDKAKAGGIG